jgi:hypothetical protein
VIQQHDFSLQKNNGDMVCSAMREMYRSFPKKVMDLQKVNLRTLSETVKNESRGWYATALKYKTAGFEAAHGLR